MKPSRQKGLLLSQPVGGSYLMNWSTWLLISFSVCSWQAAIQCVSIRSGASFRSSDLASPQLFFQGKVIVLERLPWDVIHCPQSNSVNSHTIVPEPLPLSKVAQRSLDDEGRVDDSQPNDKDMNLGHLKPSPGGWRVAARLARHPAHQFI